MPALANVPSVCRIRFQGFVFSQPWVNILHLRYTGTPPTSAELQTLCASLGGDWTTALRALYATTSQLNVVDATDLTSPTSAFGTNTQAVIGTRAGTGLPANCCFVVSYHIDMRWRGGHIRNYWAAGVTADLAGGRGLDTTPLSQFNAGATAWLNALSAKSLGGRTWSLVGVRYTSGGVALADPIVLPVTSIHVHDRMDSQRRRLGKETG